jgi:hypothetical protein
MHAGVPDITGIAVSPIPEGGKILREQVEPVAGPVMFRVTTSDDIATASRPTLYFPRTFSTIPTVEPLGLALGHRDRPVTRQDRVA